jgi:hypothetical protein
MTPAADQGVLGVAWRNASATAWRPILPVAPAIRNLRESSFGRLDGSFIRFALGGGPAGEDFEGVL